MPRTYSFDHFQAKKPVQTYVGPGQRLGTREEEQRPLKSELVEQARDTLPGAGGLHYGQEHLQTVKRFQELRAARARQEASTRKAAAKKAAAKKAAAKKAAPKKAATAKRAAPRKVAAKKQAPRQAAAKKAPEPRRASAEAMTDTKQGILSRPIRKVAKMAEGVKRLAREAVAARTGRAASKKAEASKKPGPSRKGPAKKR